MAMMVLNNSSTLIALGDLNRSSNKVVKNLKKLSTGQKINSASDNASAYGISEKMKAQIRGLEQAISNIQNDSAMMKTAEGAVMSTLEIVKAIKEKAIDAANDSNTDEDRKTIQKEIDHFIDQVDDNSLVTFNGKYLLDGSSAALYVQDIDDKEAIIRGLSSAWISDALDLIEESYGISFEQVGNIFHKLQVKFVGENEKEASQSSSALAYVSAFNDSDFLNLSINLDQVKNINIRDENGKYENSGKQYIDRIIAHELTHAVMFSLIGVENMSNLGQQSLYIIEGGTAEMTHGADDTRNILMATFNPFINGLQYEGGFIAFRYLTKQLAGEPKEIMKNFMKGLIASGGNADAAFSFASGGAFKTEQAFRDSYFNDYENYVVNSGHSESDFLKNYCGINLTNEDTGSITGLDAGGKVLKKDYSVVPQVSRTMNWSLPSSSMTIIKGLQVYWPKGYNAGTTGGSLNFQTGAEANQAIHVGLFDMRARSIGLINQEGDKINVTTIGNANQTIGIVDKIIGVILDEATNIGAIQERLNYTSSNATVSLENTQGAESTIRDADMAREVTEYTKNNVLSQVAQSMLAQANQTLSSVLSLLQ